MYILLTFRLYGRHLAKGYHLYASILMQLLYMVMIPYFVLLVNIYLKYFEQNNADLFISYFLLFSFALSTLFLKSVYFSQSEWHPIFLSLQFKHGELFIISNLFFLCTLPRHTYIKLLRTYFPPLC